MLTTCKASNLTTVYICKSFASLHLGTGNVKKRLSCAREFTEKTGKLIFREGSMCKYPRIETNFSRLEIFAKLKYYSRGLEPECSENNRTIKCQCKQKSYFNPVLSYLPENFLLYYLRKSLL